MTHMLGAVAPLAVLLEGGYNLRATAAGCEAVLRVLLGQKVPAFSRPAVPSTPGLMAIQQVIRTQVLTVKHHPLEVHIIGCILGSCASVCFKQ